MIIRVVSFELADGKDQEFRQFGKREVIPINLNAGAIDCYILEHSKEAGRSGIISVWQSAETLTAMRATDEYQDLLSRLRAMITGPLVDDVYKVLE